METVIGGAALAAVLMALMVFVGAPLIARSVTGLPIRWTMTPRKAGLVLGKARDMVEAGVDWREAWQRYKHEVGCLYISRWRAGSADDALDELFYVYMLPRVGPEEAARMIRD